MNSSAQQSEQHNQQDHGHQQTQHQRPDSQPDSEGYRQAIQLMHACCTQEGFLATTTRQDNYRRIWARDSCIVGLAALLSGDAELIDGCRRSLHTLAEYQGPHGEISSNVDAQTDRVSYGGTAGRIDADLWFVIVCGAYWRFTGDDEFLRQMVEPLEKVRFLPGCWEFNNRGLLYVPSTGDWADEYLQSGYVLYDQLLYLQAQREFCIMHRHLHKTSDQDLQDRVSRLKHLIRANYWFASTDDTPGDVYHEVLFEKGRKAASNCRNTHWMPFFSPLGYGYRFDAMANSLVSLLGVADDDQNPEYVHGKTHRPGGTFPMNWSAASAVIAECSLRGKRVFETDPATEVPN